MALTTQPLPAKVQKILGHTSMILLHGEEKATQTYVRGAFIQDDGAGRISESVSPIDGSGVTKRTIGIAGRSATGVTGADVPFVFIANSLTVIEATLSDATAGVKALLQAHKWMVYPITKGTANWYLDTNAAAANGGLVIDSVNTFPKDIGVVDCRVLFVLTAATRGGLTAASGAL